MHDVVITLSVEDKIIAEAIAKAMKIQVEALKTKFPQIKGVDTTTVQRD